LHRDASVRRPRGDQILRLSRDELIAEIGRGEIDLLTQTALVSIIWQKEIVHALVKAIT
jgi:hypothetical protein